MMIMIVIMIMIVMRSKLKRSVPLGYYMYIEATGKSKGDKAQLLSPRYPKTTGRCLEFWYHMYGSDIGTLTVYKKVRFCSGEF